MKLQLLAAPILVALILSPMFAAAAAGTIAFSSPAAGSSFSNTGAYTITGTISPTPTLPDNVVITVTLQGSVSPVDEQTVAVGAGGTFSYATTYGGAADWTTGTYTITAFDSSAATGTTTFKYTAGITMTSTSGYLTIEAPTVLQAGQSSNIDIWTSGPGTIVAWYLAPGATSTTSLSTSQVVPYPGGLDVYTATVTLGSAAANGVYLVGATVTNSSSSLAASNIASFTVNNGIASQTAVTALQTSVTALQTSVTALTTSLSGITASIAALGTSVTSANAGIASLNTAVTSLQGTVGTIGTTVSGLGTSVSGLTTQVNTLSSTVSGISSSLGTISSSISTLQSSVQGVSSSISTLTSDVTTLQSTVGGIQTTVNGLSGLSGQMTSLQTSLTNSMSGLQTSVSNLSSSVSNEQTYILVVAALAVITLVLELAILIRKMS